MSIPDLAVEIIKTTIDASDENARTIIIVGSKSVGKSTLLHIFLEKPEAPKETLVLEYSFGRKSSQRQSIEKTICHVWEYGGRVEMLINVLSSIPMQGASYFCVVLDLSNIKGLWNTLEICVQAMIDNYKDAESLPELIIIGGKYDLFKNYDTEIKKCICTTIRSFALLHNANVIFYSSKEAQLVKKTKDMFNNIGFGNGIIFKDKNTNFNKPLLIPKAFDTWENIGYPKSTVEQIKERHFLRIAPQTEIKEDIQLLPRSHPEPILDSLAALKYEELRKMDLYDSCIDEYLSLLQ